MTMDNRPKLEPEMDSSAFQNHYYLKEELVQFCRQCGLQSTGAKEDITKRIAHFLETGKKLSACTRKKHSAGNVRFNVNSMIEDGFVCTQEHRAFFRGKYRQRFFILCINMLSHTLLNNSSKACCQVFSHQAR